MFGKLVAASLLASALVVPVSAKDLIVKTRITNAEGVVVGSPKIRTSAESEKTQRFHFNGKFYEITAKTGKAEKEGAHTVELSVSQMQGGKLVEVYSPTVTVLTDRNASIFGNEGNALFEIIVTEAVDYVAKAKIKDADGKVLAEPTLQVEADDKATATIKKDDTTYEVSITAGNPALKPAHIIDYKITKSENGKETILASPKLAVANDKAASITMPASFTFEVIVNVAKE